MKTFTLFILVLCISFSLASQDLQIIHATSASVDIRDGKNLRKSYWTINPKYNPDEYKTTVTGEKEIVP